MLQVTVCAVKVKYGCKRHSWNWHNKLFMHFMQCWTFQSKSHLYDSSFCACDITGSKTNHQMKMIKKKTSSVPLRLWWVIFINAKYIILSFLINKFPSGLYSNLFLTQLPCLNTQLLRYCVIAVLTIAVTHHCISGTLHYTVNTTINKAHCILHTAWHTPISTLHW